MLKRLSIFVALLLVAFAAQAQMRALPEKGKRATVDAQPEFSADGTHVRVAFSVREGPPVFVDHVLIVGNVRTRTDTVQRELQVAELVAEGLTNQAIASRLSIAPRTAETHVENIRRKLQVNSRAQIAAWVTRHQLYS